MSDPEEREKAFKRRQRNLLAKELRDKKYRQRVLPKIRIHDSEEPRKISIRDYYNED